MSNDKHDETDEAVLDDDALELAAGGVAQLGPNPPPVNITYGYDTTT
jgi:hypothetical protein